MNGISVIICCYNSSTRLPATLGALRRQATSLPWEVVVVDNASSDNTALTAKANWPIQNNVSLQVEYEGTPGLNYARLRGFERAKYEIVVFVDDDNWLEPCYLQAVWDSFRDHPRLGACGGRIIAQYEVQPPPWLHEFAGALAVSSNNACTGVLPQGKYLCGAGLAIRKEAWNSLYENGFVFMTTDRCGSVPLGGGDTELCYALQLAGWQLYYSDSMELRHFIPRSRCNWAYFRNLFRSHGTVSPFLDPYEWALAGRPQSWLDDLRKHWLWQVGAGLKSMAVQPRRWLRAWYNCKEGERDALLLAGKVGRIQSLLQLRSRYSRNIEILRDQHWVRMASATAASTRA